MGIKYSDIFPLSVSGGSSSIAGLTSQGTKSTDFTSSPNSLYEITASCVMTLHSNPTVGDKVGFILTSTVNFDITSTDKFNGFFLATDYTKRVTQLYAIIVLTYSGATNGWVWESRDNSYITDGYTGEGVILPYTSTNTLDGVINWIGTNGGLNAYSNPCPSLVTVTGRSTTYPNNVITVSNPQNLFDKNQTTYPTVSGLTSTSNDVGVVINFPTGRTLIPTTLVARFTTVWNNGATLVWEGIKNDNSFEVLASTNIPQYFETWSVLNYSGNGSFKAFYVHGTRSFYDNYLNEIEVWGLYV